MSLSLFEYLSQGDLCDIVEKVLQWVLSKSALYTLNIDKYLDSFLFLKNFLYLRKPKIPSDPLTFRTVCVDFVR